MNQRVRQSGLRSARWIERLEDRRYLTTYVVTSAADTGVGSLRQAILDANLSAGADRIEFAIGSGVVRIVPQTPLPAITDTVTLDATTQPGYAGSPVVEIVAPGVTTVSGTNSNGLEVASNGSLVRGLAIDGFKANLVLSGSGNRAAGNYLGISSAGVNLDPASALEIQADGVVLGGVDNVVGGTNVGDRNVVSGSFVGINVQGDRYLIQGNYIGTNVAGNSGLPNRVGIQPFSTTGTIGGTVAAARNVISGNSIGGITMTTSSSGPTGSNFVLRIQGNYIGTDAAGLVAVPNGSGVRVGEGTILVGGTEAGAGNIVSGNIGGGIGVGSILGSAIQGNLVGVNVNLAPLGNGGDGVGLSGGTLLGGTGLAPNHIAYNGGRGAVVTATYNGNRLQQNIIYANAGIGVDVNNDGPTPRDYQDLDQGTNGLQNAPVLTAATSAGGTTSVAGILHSNPGSMFTIEWFANDPSFGGGTQAQRFLSSTTVLTDVSGNATMSADFTSVPAGWKITATATATDGSTSELSNALAAGETATPGALTPTVWLAASSDTGYSQTDGITSDNTPTITGLASPNSTVTVFARSLAVATVPVGADGSFSVTLAEQQDTRFPIYAYSTDAVGGRSANSLTTLIEVDRTRPLSFVTVTNPVPTGGPIAAATVLFHTPIYNVNPAAITLNRDGVSVLPPNYQLEISGTGLKLNGLDAYTQSPGDYVLSALDGAVEDAAGNRSISGFAAFTRPSGVIVSLEAVQTARESDLRPAIFRLYRTGDTTASLTVNVQLTGATLGADYQAIPPSVVIPAGAAYVDVHVQPLDDTVYEVNESINLRILPNGVAYNAGAVASTVIEEKASPIDFVFDPLIARRTTPISSLVLRTVRPVSGLTINELEVIRNSTTLSPTASWSLSSPDGMTWTLSGLSASTATLGNYRVSVRLTARVIDPVFGYEVPARSNFATTAVEAPTTAAFNSGDGGTRSSALVRTRIDFSQPVYNVHIDDFVLSRDGGPNLLTSAQYVSGSYQQFWIENLGGLTSTPGSYRLTLNTTGTNILNIYGSPVTVAAELTWTLPPASPLPPLAQTRSVRALADAYVRDGTSSSQNFGSVTELLVKKVAVVGQTRESYFTFPTAGGAAGASLDGAALRLTARKVQAGALSLQLFAADPNAWTESGINWNNKPPAGTPLGNASMSGVGSAVLTFDVSAHVIAARAAGATAVSFLLKMNSATAEHVLINSDEAASGRPELQLTETTPATVVVSNLPASVPENGSRQFSVQLSAMPPVNTYVAILRRGGDGDMVVLSDGVWIAPDQWNLPQTLEIFANPDADALNGSATFEAVAYGYQSVQFTLSEADDDAIVPPPPPPPPPPPVGVTKTARASADAHVRDGTYASANFGSTATLEVKQATTGYAREAFLGFSLGAGTANVSSATLRVFVKTAEAGTAQLQLFGIADSGWTETGIKWSNRPAIGGTAIASTNVSSSAGVWLTFEVTAYVKARRAAVASRAVFAFRSGIVARPLMLVTSDEASGNRPELKWTES